MHNSSAPPPRATLWALALAACAPGREADRWPRCGGGEPPAFVARAEGRDGWTRWAAPSGESRDLSREKGEIHGPTPPPATPLARWEGEALAGWTATRHGEDLRLRSPELPRTAERLALRLRPRGADHLELVAFSTSSVDATDRVSRAERVALPAGDPEATLEIEIDLRELVGGNWADAWRDARLEALELTLPVSPGPGPTLEAAALLGPAARFAGAPAGAGTLEIDGALRPGWFVNAGASVTLTTRVPEQDPRLRWSWGADATGARAEIRVEGDGSAASLRAADLNPAWAPGEASLAPWAGQTVRLTLAAEGPGVALFGEPTLEGGPAPAAQTPDVLVYLVDALRADALHAWGDPDERASPNLDRLAAEGVQFMRAISVSSWTKPVIPSLLTGLWPTRHLVGSQRFTDRLPASVPTLQERFRDAGWRTGSFSANPLASTLSGLERGFSLALPPRAWRGRVTPLGAPTAAQLHAGLLDWVAERPDRPFFAYVHALEVHQAYRSPLSRPDPREGYASAVRDADDAIGALLEALAPRRRERPLLLAVLADHGESFGDHGLETHGTGLYQSQLHVPFLLWAGEDLPARRVQSLVSVVDLAPTLLSLAHLPALPGQDGLDLRPLLEGADALAREVVPAALLRFSWQPDAPRRYALLGPGGAKLLRVEGGAEARYALARDPCELDPTGADPALSAALDAWLAAQERGAADFARAHGAPAPAELDPETVEQLRALGYVR